MSQCCGSEKQLCGSGSLFPLDADPDSAVQCDADLDSAPHESDANLRPLVHGSILSLYFERPRPFISLFGASQLLNFEFDADPGSRLLNLIRIQIRLPNVVRHVSVRIRIRKTVMRKKEAGIGEK